MKRNLFWVGAALCPALASAQLYSENFDVDNTANWTIRKSTGANANDPGSSANFFFDYATIGIPSAPGSTGGTTRGLRMDANVTGGIFSGLSVSPNGQSFSGDYKVTADVWLNFIGPAPVGGSGSTQAGGIGVGTAGLTPQWAAQTPDSVYFVSTLDGNSSVDYRAYSTAAPTGYPDQSPVFFATGAGNRNCSHPYYAGFPGGTPPAAQTTLFPSQTGSSQVGSISFAWHKFMIEKVGNNIKFTIDALPIAQVDASTVTLGGGNLLVSYFDTNATSSTDTTGMNCMIVDNIKVEAIVSNAVLGPSSYSVNLGLNFGGTLASLQNSDNDKVVVLCDENDSNGEVQASAVTTLTTLSSYQLKVEASASRNDLSQFVRAFNFATNAYVQVSFQSTTTADSVVTGTITSNAGNFKSVDGEVRARVSWIPQADIDAGDGWTQSIDQIQWTLVP